MSTLILQLHKYGQQAKALSLVSESIIETQLIVTSGRASLPTLISVENIIGKINDQGYELASETEISKIANLINNYYLPTPKSNWGNKSIILSVTELSLSGSQYKEIRDIRQTVLQSAREVGNFEKKGDYLNSKRSQDKAVMKIAHSVEKQPNWWDKNKGKLLTFVAKTAIGLIFDTVVGIPLSRFIQSVLG